eukprot:TRINITY_DN41677_c0_g1_i1.p1 TRINITY_DN41677_c0_g1~~TRINITY_DN41677_c0_g1_i1.p1  ORF type:complete len:1078 (+),score=211.18 TRINITY_DN41677_c0_g1_i1:110-3343(+)
MDAIAPPALPRASDASWATRPSNKCSLEDVLFPSLQLEKQSSASTTDFESMRSSIALSEIQVPALRARLCEPSATSGGALVQPLALSLDSPISAQPANVLTPGGEAFKDTEAFRAVTAAVASVVVEAPGEAADSEVRRPGSAFAASLACAHEEQLQRSSLSVASAVEEAAADTSFHAGGNPRSWASLVWESTRTAHDAYHEPASTRSYEQDMDPADRCVAQAGAVGAGFDAAAKAASTLDAGGDGIAAPPVAAAAREATGDRAEVSPKIADISPSPAAHSGGEANSGCLSVDARPVAVNPDDNQRGASACEVGPPLIRPGSKSSQLARKLEPPLHTTMAAAIRGAEPPSAFAKELEDLNARFVKFSLEENRLNVQESLRRELTLPIENLKLRVAAFEESRFSMQESLRRELSMAMEEVQSRCSVLEESRLKLQERLRTEIAGPLEGLKAAFVSAEEGRLSMQENLRKELTIPVERLEARWAALEESRLEMQERLRKEITIPVESLQAQFSSSQEERVHMQESLRRELTMSLEEVRSRCAALEEDRLQLQESLRREVTKPIDSLNARVAACETHRLSMQAAPPRELSCSIQEVKDRCVALEGGWLELQDSVARRLAAPIDKLKADLAEERLNLQESLRRDVKTDIAELKAKFAAVEGRPQTEDSMRSELTALWQKDLQKLSQELHAELAEKMQRSLDVPSAAPCRVEAALQTELSSWQGRLSGLESKFESLGEKLTTGIGVHDNAPSTSRIADNCRAQAAQVELAVWRQRLALLESKVEGFGERASSPMRLEHNMLWAELQCVRERLSNCERRVEERLSQAERELRSSGTAVGREMRREVVDAVKEEVEKDWDRRGAVLRETLADDVRSCISKAEEALRSQIKGDVAQACRRFALAAQAAALIPDGDVAYHRDDHIRPTTACSEVEAGGSRQFVPKPPPRRQEPDSVEDASPPRASMQSRLQVAAMQRQLRQLLTESSHARASSEEDRRAVQALLRTTRLFAERLGVDGRQLRGSSDVAYTAACDSCGGVAEQAESLAAGIAHVWRRQHFSRPPAGGAVNMIGSLRNRSEVEEASWCK